MYYSRHAIGAIHARKLRNKHLGQGEHNWYWLYNDRLHHHLQRLTHGD